MAVLLSNQMGAMNGLFLKVTIGRKICTTLVPVNGKDETSQEISGLW